MFLSRAEAALGSIDVWVGGLAYTFQLYFDFSGYSDMAIGLACLFGLRLPVNFFSPYRAQNISDFWRMWHATLSRFLRDYVYAPLGGYFCSPRRQRFNLFMTMFAGGIWHGAGWTFVLYGVCHGVYVVAHQLWRIKVSGPLGLLNNPAYKLAAQLLTFLLVALTLILFRADSVASAGVMYSQLLMLDGWSFNPQFVAEFERTNLFRMVAAIAPLLSMQWLVCGLLALALLVCWLLPSTFQLFRDQNVALDQVDCSRPAVCDIRWSPSVFWAWWVAALAVASCLNLSSVSEFLYFQF